MEVARAWAAGTLISDRPATEPEAIADARLWGFDDAAMAVLVDQLGGPATTVRVWVQHVPAVMAFLAVATQWRTAVESHGAAIRSRYLGLDYGSAKIGIQESGITITPDLWAGLKQLELAARDALNGEPVA